MYTFEVQNKVILVTEPFESFDLGCFFAIDLTETISWFSFTFLRARTFMHLL